MSALFSKQVQQTNICLLSNGEQVNRTLTDFYIGPDFQSDPANQYPATLHNGESENRTQGMVLAPTILAEWRDQPAVTYSPIGTGRIELPLSPYQDDALPLYYVPYLKLRGRDSNPQRV